MPIAVRRTLAFLIDLIIVYTCTFLLFLFFKIDIKNSSLMVGAGFFSLVYFSLFWVMLKGKTLGTIPLRIQVVSFKEEKIAIKNILVRAGILASIIAPVGAVVFLALFNIIATFILWQNSLYKENHMRLN